MPSGFYWELLLLTPLLGVYAALRARAQNWLLLAIALALMTSWDWRFPLILLATTVVDYAIGQRLSWEEPDGRRRVWLWLGIAFDVGILAAFRLAPASGPLLPMSHWFGLSAPSWLAIAAPVGLSFYTLARMSHTLDVYFKLERPSTSLLEFVTFTSFFPLLISGPIERAGSLLPLLARRRVVSAQGIYEGSWLILLGIFQKVFLADRCAVLSQRFAPAHGGSLLTLLGILAYACQIFADFSGYSDVARGVARLFGFQVTRNFAAPYWSANLMEYWKRWHVSLSSWLDDYVYKPTFMALRDYAALGVGAALVVTFLVSALWHGRGVTFLVWGAIHATGLAIFGLSRGLRKRLKKSLPGRAWRTGATLLTFSWVCLGYVFFRAPTLSAALATLLELCSPFHWHAPDSYDLLELFCLGSGVMAVHALQAKPERALWLFARPVWLRGFCYAAMLFCIARLPGETQRFIYFQF
jgi:D-alanyl-lipoteichoic acid acyltransferase DltB (MBOAT superfamily)